MVVRLGIAAVPTHPAPAKRQPAQEPHHGVVRHRLPSRRHLHGQAIRTNPIYGVIVAVGVPVVAVPRRVLADEAPRPAVVVAMPQQAQTAVRVRLVAARLPKPQRRLRAPRMSHLIADPVPAPPVREPLSTPAPDIPRRFPTASSA